MPCPLFIPREPLGQLNPGATPLGDLFGGECAADAAYCIPASILQCCCNFGYAREQCTLASLSPDDATTFMLAARPGAGLQIRWALERDHQPIAVGQFDAGALEAPEDALAAQARAYFSVYQRRRLP